MLNNEIRHSDIPADAEKAAKWHESQAERAMRAALAKAEGSTDE